MENTPDVSIFILGEKKVGKTSLLNIYCGNNENLNFEKENCLNYTEKIIRFNEMIKNIKLGLFEYSDFFFDVLLENKMICFILIYSITDRNSFEKCKIWIKQIKEKSIKNNQILLLGSKKDDEENRKVLYNEGVKFAVDNKLLFIEYSSFNNNINIENSINLLLNNLLEPNLENLSYITIKSKKPININIIGDKSTGKNFIKSNIPNKIIVDIGEKSYLININLIKIQFDNIKNKNNFNTSNGILFIYSINNKNSFIKLEEFLKKNEFFKNNTFFPVILLGNNINKRKEEIILDEGKNLSKKKFWKFYEVSNKNDILKPILEISKLIILSKNEDLFPIETKIINDKLTINIKIPKKINKNTLNEYFGNTTYKKEGKYKGFFYNYERNGKGIMEYNNKDKYIGNWKNDKKNGFGKMNYHLIGKYKGNFQNDLRYGEGKFKYLNGDIYEGNWENNMKNGKGKMEYTIKIEEFNYDLIINQTNTINNSSLHKSLNKAITLIYNGNWLNDLWDGKGEFKYKNDIYEGVFLEGKMIGFGKIYYENGDNYIGSMNNLKKEGNGIMNYKNGNKYNGNWENDIKSGKGIMIFNNGNLFNGLWKNDQINKGIYYTDQKDFRKNNEDEQSFYDDFINNKLKINGKIFCGEFIDDKLNGNGYEFNKDYFFIGEFNLNKKNGKGTIYYLEGKVITGEWIDDEICDFFTSKYIPQRKHFSLKRKKKIEKCGIR